MVSINKRWKFLSVALLAVSWMLPACASDTHATANDQYADLRTRTQQPAADHAPAPRVELPAPTRTPEPFALSPLPYDYDAMEPYIDAETMRIHHSFHHQSYVNNLNEALGQHPELFGHELTVLLSHLDALPEDIRQRVRNNGGGHFNHMLFWQVMGPEHGSEPEAEFAQVLNQEFGSTENLKALLKQAALSRFGAGWAWLAVNQQGELEVMSTPNQDTPLAQGALPILGIDVWEHAYYLKFRNRRGEYVDAFFEVVNWDAVAELYSQATAAQRPVAKH